jgi:hypothetical protein
MIKESDEEKKQNAKWENSDLPSRKSISASELEEEIFNDKNVVFS